MDTPFRVTCDRPHLVADFAEPQTMLSWALLRPGFQTCRKVAWLEVRNADLPPEVDPVALLEQRMAAAGHADALALMTSRDVRRHHLGRASAREVVATCLATVGLSNAARVGAPHGSAAPVAGTINLLLHLSCGLSEAALVETVAMAAQARTAAILALGVETPGGIASGTGTDCIVVAAPARGPRARFAGLHTRIGEAAGAAVLAAVGEGGAVWCRERRAGAETGAPPHPQPGTTPY